MRINRITEFLTRLTISTIMFSISFSVLSELAYLERGYYAIGGEILIVITITVITFIKTKNIVDRIFNRKVEGRK